LISIFSITIERHVLFGWSNTGGGNKYPLDFLSSFSFVGTTIKNYELYWSSFKNLYLPLTCPLKNSKYFEIASSSSNRLILMGKFKFEFNTMFSKSIKITYLFICLFH
jgi:hypothetical protein